MEIKITNYSCYDNGIVSETENISNIMNKMVRLAANLTERHVGDIYYDMLKLNNAINEKEQLDNLFFFHKNGVTTSETNKLTAELYDGLLCFFTPIQTWRLTYNPDTMEIKLIRVNVRKEGLY